MFWMRNKENNFPIHTLIWRPECWHPINGKVVCIYMYPKCSISYLDLGYKLLLFKIEIHILSLHRMMKNISYFNVSEKPQGHLGNIKIASSASLNMNFNPYIYIIDFQSNSIN